MPTTATQPIDLTDELLNSAFETLPAEPGEETAAAFNAPPPEGYPMPPEGIQPPGPTPSLDQQDDLDFRQMMMRQRAPGVVSTTAGGPPAKAFPDFGVAAAQTADLIGEGAEEVASEPSKGTIAFTQLVPPVRPDESMLSAGLKTGARAALGIPEFMTSKLGVATLGLGGLAPRLTSALFSADMLSGAVAEFPELQARWDTMTPAQKTEAVVGMGATILMGLGLGYKAAKGFAADSKGLPNETQRQAVEAFTELAQTNPKAFEETLKNITSKAVPPEQRMPLPPVMVQPTPSPAKEPEPPTPLPEAAAAPLAAEGEAAQTIVQNAPLLPKSAEEAVKAGDQALEPPPPEPAAPAAQPKEENARSVEEAAAVHGDLRAPAGEGEGQVPAEEGGGGVQPPPEGQLPEVAGPPGPEVLVNRGQTLAGESDLRFEGVFDPFPADMRAEHPELPAPTFSMTIMDGPAKGGTIQIPVDWTKEQIAEYVAEKQRQFSAGNAAPAPAKVGSVEPQPEEKTPTQAKLVDVPAAQIPAGEIAVRPDLMQFKRIDEAASGVNEAEKLEGKWDDLKAGLLLLWEPKDPAAYGLKPAQKYIVANGHHRLEFGERQGVKGYNAQIVRETDGYSASEARRLGAEINIADGKGTIYDQAKFIRNTAATLGQDEALAEAGRIGAKGRKAANIAVHASDSLFDAFINERISPEHAEAIAVAEPGNEAAQRVGIRQVLEEKLTPGQARGAVEAAIEGFKRAGGEKASQGDFFANTDMDAEWGRQGKAVEAERQALREQILAVQGAARRPEMAAKLGVDVKDPAGVQTRIKELKADLERWDRWRDYPDLKEKILGPEKVTPPVAPAAPVAPKPAGGDLFGGQTPFNLAGEKPAAPETKPAEVTTGFGNETLAQQEMFSISKITESVDPVKSADAAEKMYGGPSKAAAKLEEQLRVVDADKVTRKAFLPEQRKRLQEVVALLRQRAAGDEGAAPLPVGPGAMAKAQTMPSELKQLESALGALPKDVPAPSFWRQRIKESFRLGEKLAEGKDALAKGLNGLRTMGAAMWQKLAKFDTFTPWLKILGENQLAREQSSLEARQFAKSVLREMPVLRDIKTREAITKWIEADGDPAILNRGVAEAPAGRKRAYQDALKLSPEAKAAAQHVQQYFEARLNDAIKAGILEDGIENYIHRIYEKNTPWKAGVLADLRAGRLSTAKPGLAKQRVFQYDFEAEKAGYKPVNDFLERVLNYDISLNRAIADRTMVKQALKLDMPDGRPMFDTAGKGIPIEDPAGVREATLVKPRAKTYSKDPIDNRGDYVVYDHPSFRKWKWIGKDDAGKPIYVQGDVLVHPEALATVKRLLDKSAVREWRPFGLEAGRAALSGSSIIKQTMLDLSGFHMVQIGVHGLEHRAVPLPESVVGGRGMPKLDLSDPKQAFLVSHGLTVADVHNYQMYTEGSAGSAFAKVPVLGPLLTANHDFLFKEFIPRTKMSMALHALERNRKAFAKDLASGKMTEDDLGYLTAKQANAAFGGLNYEMLGRSKTAQDISRIAALAPDFLEARARFAGQAFTKYGTEQRVALIFGAAALYTLARIANKAISGNPHNEPENALSLVVNGRAYSLRTVQGDIMHLLTEPSKFAFHRLNPVYGRTALEFLTHRDEFGRQRNYVQQAKDFATTAIPISLRSSREQKMWESALNAFGVTNRRWDGIASMYKKAEKFRKPAPGEFIYDPEKDPLRALKNDLLYNPKSGDAVLEIQRLVKEKQTTTAKLQDHFERYATSPFTGSRASDRQMFNSLSEADKQVYREAVAQKKEIYRRWREARAAALPGIRASQ